MRPFLGGFMERLKREYLDLKLLLKSVPTAVTVIFVMGVFSMNLLANKSVNLPFDWLAFDAGTIISWIAFLIMDVITVYFGAKAAVKLSAFAVVINLLFCGFLFLGSIIPGRWGEADTLVYADVINNALDRTFGGTWYVIVGSNVAFLVSSLVNNLTNAALGRVFKKKTKGFSLYALRTYLSTIAGQFVDNFVFALIVSRIFFGWTYLQCASCALFCMLFELLCEILFSGIGYRICKSWKAKNIGAEYFKTKQMD